MSNEEVMAEAVETIINTRDFCGDESAALRMVEDDHGIRFTNDERAEIWARVNGTWRDAQKAAGAKILSDHERAQAFKALEDDEW